MSKKVKIPDEAEDRAITEAAQRDLDNPPLDDAFFSNARRGRPPLPKARRKRRVNLMLDPDVIAMLKSRGNMSAEVNEILRDRLGLQPHDAAGQ